MVGRVHDLSWGCCGLQGYSITSVIKPFFYLDFSRVFVLCAFFSGGSVWRRRLCDQDLGLAVSGDGSKQPAH